MFLCENGNHIYSNKFQISEYMIIEFDFLSLLASIQMISASTQCIYWVTDIQHTDELCKYYTYKYYVYL